MPVKPLKPGEVPESVLGDLKTLMPDKFEYVSIGSNVYQLYPLPALKLLDLVASFIEALRDLRKRILQELQESLSPEEFQQVKNTVMITVPDMISDEKSRKVLLEIAQAALEGADPEDIQNMTAGQLAILLDKILKINLETIPETMRQTLFGFMTPQQEQNPQGAEQKKGGNGSAPPEVSVKNP